MKIGIHGKEFKKEHAPAIARIFEILRDNDIQAFVSSRFDSHLKHHQLFRNIQRDVYEANENTSDFRHLKFFLSIGGDGTLLESVTHVGHWETPILGINTGRLGFLATIGKDEIEGAIKKIVDGAFTLDKRAVLKVESDQKVFGNLNFALNDFTVVKKDTSSMITIHTFIDGEFLNSYWADGIIVATPTGSTGYSLSCGGPLIFPRSGNFAITPVSPHNLTVRPIIVSDSSVISFQIEGRSKKFLVSLDSRISTVDHTAKLSVRKGDFKVNLIQLEGQHYFKTLRQKLNWGLDIRN
jgi:NAD+ kinase